MDLVTGIFIGAGLARVVELKKKANVEPNSTTGSKLIETESSQARSAAGSGVNKTQSRGTAHSCSDKPKIFGKCQNSELLVCAGLVQTTIALHLLFKTGKHRLVLQKTKKCVLAAHKLSKSVLRFACR